MLEALERVHQAEVLNQEAMGALVDQLKTYEIEQKKKLEGKEKGWQEAIEVETLAKQKNNQEQLNRLKEKLLQETKKEQLLNQQKAAKNKDSVVQAIIEGVLTENGGS